MSKRVLNVGHCGPDHSAIRAYLTHHFECEVIPAQGPDDTIEMLRNGMFDLVLVNRKLDRDYADGIDIIRRIKGDAATSDVPVMLVTNFSEHQDAAMAAGALRGFGKLEFDEPATRERLAAMLSS